MNVDDFQRLKVEFQEFEEKLLGSKRAEYADNVDVLRNFKEQAVFIGLDSEIIAMILVFKHVQGIKEAVVEGKINWEWETKYGREGTKQRIADARNYLLLLAGLLDEGYNEPADEEEARAWEKNSNTISWAGSDGQVRYTSNRGVVTDREADQTDK